MYQVSCEWYNLNFIKFEEIRTLLAFFKQFFFKSVKEFALYSIREKLFQIKKKKKKKRVSRIRIDPKNTLSRELRWILLNGTFHFLFARAYIPPLYRSMFQFPRSIANYDDMEPDFSPVATIIDNCIRNFQQSKIIPWPNNYDSLQFV